MFDDFWMQRIFRRPDGSDDPARELYPEMSGFVNPYPVPQDLGVSEWGDRRSLMGETVGRKVIPHGGGAWCGGAFCEYCEQGRN